MLVVAINNLTIATLMGSAKWLTGCMRNAKSFNINLKVKDLCKIENLLRYYIVSFHRQNFYKSSLKHLFPWSLFQALQI